MAEIAHPSPESLAGVVTAYVERHGGPTKVAAAVGADRTTVHRWMRGNVPIDKLELLAERLGEPLVLRFGPGTTKEPPPEWARAMESRLVEAIEGRLPSDLVMRAYEVIQRLEGRRPPRGEDPPEESDAQDPDGAGPQVQADGLPPVPRDEG